MVESPNLKYVHMYDPDSSGKADSYFAQYGVVYSSFAPDRVAWLSQADFPAGTEFWLYFQGVVVHDTDNQFALAPGTPDTGAQPFRNQFAYRIGDIPILRDGGTLDGYTVDRTWFLTAPGGGWLYADNGDTVWLNIANPSVRSWALERILDRLAAYPIFTGVWFDNHNINITTHTGSLLTSVEYGAGDSAAAQAAMVDWFKYFHDALHALNIPVGGNVQGEDIQAVKNVAAGLDLIFREHAILTSAGQYDTDANVDTDINVAIWAASVGKAVSLRGSIDYDLLTAGNGAALARMNYFMAAAHIVMGTNLSVKVDDDYSRAYLPPSLDDWNAIGRPISNPEKLTDGRWYRQYSNGAVYLDATNQTYTRTITNPSYFPLVLPPLVAPVPLQTRTFWDAANLRVYARSTDGSTLSYAVSNPPPGWVINPETGEFTGKLEPSALDVFVYSPSVEITATLLGETHETSFVIPIEAKTGAYLDGFNSGGGALTFEDGVIGADTNTSSAYRQNLPDGFNQTSTAFTWYGERYSFLPDDLGEDYLFKASGTGEWLIDVSSLSGQAHVIFVLRTGASNSSFTLAMPQVSVSFDGDFYEAQGAGANRVQLRGFVVDVSAIDDLQITLTSVTGTVRFAGVLVYEYLADDPNPDPEFSTEYTLELYQVGAESRVRLLYGNPAAYGLTAQEVVVSGSVGYHLVGFSTDASTAALFVSSLKQHQFEGWYEFSLDEYRYVTSRAIEDGLTPAEIQSVANEVI